jgi:STE24 endopeptidase
MQLDNPWFIFTALSLIGLFHLDLVAAFLNLAALRRELPARLAASYTPELRMKQFGYHGDSVRVQLMEAGLSLGLFLGVWWAGGFPQLQNEVMSWGYSAWVTDALVMAAILFFLKLVHLPFEIWSTFGVEARYGFNQMRTMTFVKDVVKGLVFLILVGAPLLLLVLWCLHHVNHAFFWAWGLVVVFGGLLTWLAPRFFMPWFMKFTPLEPGPLRDAIVELAAKLNFPAQDVCVVDGSTRSTKANAFFAGFGKTRRIALYDTLIQQLSVDEIVAVLAHEIGHWRCRHVPLRLVLSAAELGFTLWLASLVLDSVSFFEAFGIQSGRPIGLGLALFSWVYAPVGRLLSLGSGWLSRRHEFEADAFAAQAVGRATNLIQGLEKLNTEHLSHPQPHALTVWLEYSHPPLLQRVQALES